MWIRPTQNITTEEAGHLYFKVTEYKKTGITNVITGIDTVLLASQLGIDWIF